MAETSRIMSDENGPVLTCKVEDCSYNDNECCRAPSIQVGDEHPRCDTYTHDMATAKADIATVSECHVGDCYFNKSQSCHAAGITVGFHSGHADCYTARTQ